MNQPGNSLVEPFDDADVFGEYGQAVPAGDSADVVNRPGLRDMLETVSPQVTLFKEAIIPR